MVILMIRVTAALFFLSLFPHGCTTPGSPSQVRLNYPATGTSPQVLALYEAWFGLPSHISVGYSSHDPAVIRRQIDQAKARGISAFVVDWYGDREPFIDVSYALMQKAAAKQHFHVAMMYEETKQDDGATDEAIADFTMFHDTYLSQRSKGHEAYLTYQGRPVIFIFRGGGHTDWSKVRAVVDKWNPAPLLIYKSFPVQNADAFDGFYPWINPGTKGWAANGDNWGQNYLDDFYQTMLSKYPDKMIVGGAWPGFDDSKASWSLNRHMSARCGQTFWDTFGIWRKYVPADQAIPFLLIQTWNDYEEGSALEPGVPTCGGTSQQSSPNNSSANVPASPTTH